jgi:lambda family phage portal protein
VNLKKAFEGLLFLIAPKRMASYYAYRQLKAAEKGRLYGSWNTKEEKANDNLLQLNTVRARANYLYNNDPWIRAAVDFIVNKAVGAGTKLQALTDNEAFNDKAENLFKRWCFNADISRQFHFGDIERLAVIKLYLDGGVFFKKIIDPDNRETAPFSLEILEYSRLSSYGKPAKGNEIWHGVEIDKNGKVVAYHFEKNTVGYSVDTVRVPADEIIHFSPFRRPGQLLGIPLLAPAIPYAFNLGEILEAELINMKVSASFGLVIKKNNMSDWMAGAQTNYETGQREIEIAPGMVEVLNPGEDIEVIDPKRPGNAFGDFVKIVLRGIGRSIGLSYEQISGDKSEVNYSSTRHSELEFRDYLQSLRASIERYFLTPIYEEFVKYAVSLGNLNVMGAIKDWRNWTKHRWIFKGFDWVDPQKEAKAKELELKMGITTLAEIAAQKGKDWKDLINQRQKEIQYLNDKGLLDISQADNPEMANIGGNNNASSN